MSVIDAINAVLTGLSTLLLVPIAVFSIECLAALLSYRRYAQINNGTPLHEQHATRAAVLIPAHNEQTVIRRTLQALASESGKILVVADNCDDGTAETARLEGAEVVVRVDPAHRGKGFALHHGLAALKSDPPEVIVVLDADCIASPGAIDTLAHEATTSRRPVQALNLTDLEPASGPVQAVSLLANRLTNLVRPLGLARLGVPCRLLGTGMAIPWRLAVDVPPRGDSLVEDMQLGIDLALRGHLPMFCPEARVASALPPADRAFVSQRTRWDQGHLQTAVAEAPRLLAAALRRRSWPLLGMALDLCVPPLTLLMAFWLAGVLFVGVAGLLGASWLPTALLLGGGAVMSATLAVVWAAFCRRQVPLRTFVAVPLYMLRKMPIYARFAVRRQRGWVRTDRPATVSDGRSERPMTDRT